MVRNLKEIGFDNWQQGKRWMDLSEWAQIMKIFVTHVNADQSSSSAEEELNIRWTE